jgi:hypothetical protein
MLAVDETGAAMHIELVRQEAIDAWTVCYRDVWLTRPSEVIRWRSLLGAALAKLGPRRAFLLLCLDGVVIRTEMVPLYGKAVGELLRPHVVFRYGGSLSTVTTIRLAATRYGFSSFIYPSYGAAVQALHAMRTDALVPGVQAPY